ncbi:MAG: phosphatase PAP2 family protein [Lachnospiraceae bacterium]|nr:phosphatase PAP2 family protein [Lachnospiraceae bacterium]
MSNFLKKYKHFLFIVYLPVYMYCFLWLEARKDLDFTNIHCGLDDKIPFLEIFIIPYLLWFLYVIVIIVYLFFQTDHLEDYYKCVFTLMSGMTTCLFIYYIFPNMQQMRPVSFTHQNICIDIIQFIYKSDTDTNVFPSIHVFNAVAVHVGFVTSYGFRKKKGWKMASRILCILICLSTMFLKQHSLLDVLGGLFLYGIYGTMNYILFPKWRSRGKITGDDHYADRHKGI